MGHFVIELFFDTALEQYVRALWRDLAAAGISEDLALDGARPHLSVCSFRDIAIDHLGAKMRGLSARSGPVSMEMLSLGVFLSPEEVLYLSPTVSAELLALHAGIVDAVRQSGGAIGEYYEPGRWVPHCSLAVGLDQERMAAAITLVRKRAEPVSGWVQSAVIVEIRPPSSTVVGDEFVLVGR